MSVELENGECVQLVAILSRTLGNGERDSTVESIAAVLLKQSPLPHSGRRAHEKSIPTVLSHALHSWPCAPHAKSRSGGATAASMRTRTVTAALSRFVPGGRSR